MIPYLLLAASTVLFGSQFFFQRRFNQSEGSTLHAAVAFALLTSAVRIVYTFVSSGFQIGHITWFSLLLAGLGAADSLLCSWISAKAFAFADMALYSLFIMLGGMFLPSAYGIIIGEPLTVGKVVCFLLIAAALFLGCDFKSTGGRKAIKYYIGVAVTNGMFGVLSVINANNKVLGADSNTYLLMNGAWTLLFCGIILLVKRQKLYHNFKIALLTAVGHGVCNTVGNLFQLFTLTVLPASVVSPVTTGGTIAVSAILAKFKGESLTWRKIVAALIAIAASVGIAYYG